MSTINGKPEIRSLDRRDGAVAYEVNGTGPLIICIPGMGELRGSFRFLAPQLLAAGYRVAVMDLRGHGDSDHSFAEYGDGPTAGDIQALTLKLGGPAILVGNSMSAGSAVLVAAQHPELVSGLVLLGPFVRDPDHSGLARLATRVLMARTVGSRGLEPLLAKALRWNPASRLQPVPGGADRRDAPARLRQGILPNDPHPTSRRRTGAARRQGTRTGRHGRAGPGLPRSHQRGAVDHRHTAW